MYGSGNRFLYRENFFLHELHFSDDGCHASKEVAIQDYTTPALSFVVLNETTLIVVYSGHNSTSYISKFLDINTGIFSGKIDMFDDHKEFQISGDLLLAAFGQKVVAYNLHNLTFAWISPSIAPENIYFLRYKDGMFYYNTPNYVGYNNASTFEQIKLVALSGNGNVFAEFSNGVFFREYGWNSVAAFDNTNGRFIRQYVGMTSAVYNVLLNGDYLYVGSSDSNVYKFDFLTTARVLVFAGHSNAIRTTLIRGQFLFTASDDFTIRRWNIDTGESLFTYYGHNEMIWKLQIYDYKLFSITYAEIKSWDLTRERLLTTYFDKSSVFVSLYTANNKLISCSLDGTITLWNVDKGIRASGFIKEATDSYVVSTQVLNDSLAIAQRDGSIVALNNESEQIWFHVTDPFVKTLSAFVVSRDVLFVFGIGEGLAVKNLTSDVVQKVHIFNYVSNALVVIDKNLFSGNNDSTITKFNSESLSVISTVKAHNAAITALGIYGKQLVSGSEDNSLKTWSIDDMNLVLHLRRDSSRLGHTGPITALYVEGHTLFSGSDDNTVKRWDLSTGKMIFTYFGHKKRITHVYYHNSSLYTTAEDEIIQIFNVYIAPPEMVTSSSTSATLTRIPPRNSTNGQESTSISLTLLIIIIVAAVVLTIVLVFTCRWLTVKISQENSSPEVANYSGQDTVNITAGVEMTLAPTSIGVSIPASKLVTERDYILLGRLGKGGGGEVFYATPLTGPLKLYGEKIVAKKMPKSYAMMSVNERSMFDQEIGIMEMLKGRGHFVELLGYGLNPCVILMKLYSHGSLSAWIQNSKRFWTKRLMTDFISDIFNAVSIMHKIQLAHCDLKPDNILIDEPQPGYFTCVLTDFGITQILSDSIIDAKAFKYINVRGVSVRYAAPEAFLRFRKKKYLSNAIEIMAGDLYSLATIVYEMLTKRSPWTGN
jgi:WD40 repeat protein/tRNA A-37 threonylcarbamoyl transferase component Bud32